MSLTRTGIKRFYSRLTQQSQKEWQESQKESQPSTKKKKKKPETQIFTKEETTTKKKFQNLLGMKVFKRCGRVSKESHKTYKHVRESQM